MNYDINKIREDFTILKQKVYDKPLVYLDNAATTQKPKQVTAKVTEYYEKYNSNIHRGVHALSQQATEEYGYARAKAMKFINAQQSKEIIFVRGTTEGINLVAQTFGREKIKKGDNIIVSEMEHHSNIVPWQMLAKEKDIELRVLPVNDLGELKVEQLPKLIDNKTKLLAVSHVSNVLGTINPIKKIVTIAHEKNVPVLVDGAQAVPHIPVDVQDLDCDFYVFSGHKVYGPTGVGVLYGKEELLNEMPPYQGGGDMICSVTFDKTKYRQLPHRFEAGTPNIAGAIGLKAALNYVQEIGLEKIAEHEKELLKFATAQLKEIPGIRIIGESPHKAAVIAFVVDKIHPHDIGTLLDQEGIAIRTGHHCAQPLGDSFGVPASTRVSFGLYNTKEEVTAFIAALKKAINFLS